MFGHQYDAVSRVNKENTRTHTFSTNFEAIPKGPGWIPSLGDLYAMSIPDVVKFRLTELMWALTDDEILRLAFRFSDS